jgi:hypothetical protein
MAKQGMWMGTCRSFGAGELLLFGLPEDPTIADKLDVLLDEDPTQQEVIAFLQEWGLPYQLGRWSVLDQQYVFTPYSRVE